MMGSVVVVLVVAHERSEGGGVKVWKLIAWGSVTAWRNGVIIVGGSVTKKWKILFPKMYHNCTTILF